MGQGKFLEGRCPSPWLWACSGLWNSIENIHWVETSISHCFLSNGKSNYITTILPTCNPLGALTGKCRIRPILAKFLLIVQEKCSVQVPPPPQKSWIILGSNWPQHSQPFSTTFREHPWMCTFWSWDMQGVCKNAFGMSVRQSTEPETLHTQMCVFVWMAYASMSLRNCRDHQIKMEISRWDNQANVHNQ